MEPIHFHKFQHTYLLSKFPMQNIMIFRHRILEFALSFVYNLDGKHFVLKSKVKSFFQQGTPSVSLQIILH